MYTDEQLEKFQFSEAYANWLIGNSFHYNVFISNGDMLTDAQENAVGFEDFIETLGK